MIKKVYVLPSTGLIKKIGYNEGKDAEKTLGNRQEIS